MTSLQTISTIMIKWYDEHQRDLPWRRINNPYYIWISEMMLQQTQVKTATPYYHRFIETCPTIEDLANIDDEQLLKLWQGLGYYNRVRNMKKTAIIISSTMNGVFPRHPEELVKLPGIGPYSAGAIASIAFGVRTPAIDGNVLRILSRLTMETGDVQDPIVRKRLANVLVPFLPEERCGDFNQSLMDLGATICLANGTPLCEKCPLEHLCQTHLHEATDRIPFVPLKKERPIEARTVLLIHSYGQWLIRKRDAKGLLAGLWEYPNYSLLSTEQEVASLIMSWGLEPISITKSSEAIHRFTHLEWHMNGYIVEANSKDTLPTYWKSVTFSDILSFYSIPTAFSAYTKVIEKYERSINENNML